MSSRQKNTRGSKSTSARPGSAVQIIFAIIALLVILSLIVSAFVQL